MVAEARRSQPTAPAWAMWTSLALAVAAAAIATYLTIEHFTTPTLLACPDIGAISCRRVTSSEYAGFLGVPVALLGLLYSLAMVALTLPAAWRTRMEWVRPTRLLLAGLGAVFVVYLIYAELFLVGAVCLWCTAVHVLAIALFAVIALGTAASTGPR
jgi:uncharacterized membrane protein